MTTPASGAETYGQGMTLAEAVQSALDEADLEVSTLPAIVKRPPSRPEIHRASASIPRQG
jgi:hypothetical protein